MRQVSKKLLSLSCARDAFIYTHALGFLFLPSELAGTTETSLWWLLVRCALETKRERPPGRSGG